ncbi:LacI family transcriptional regulator [Xaviernesmea oryzae]|uniref:LacI family transcriptional regulator n=1 Tax=Xaviernesmea oryzae TaxID=464029 RepID=A0A1Q9AQU4_9HYPH|nr:LacI family DNA-binding transcriptional regulator [Xaviernesmea oryzae]OLP57792.1 LacI family transcriptional regulator [Xaviernesmea oryzae]SEL36858.1 transcriptional regulator, LacI family [Xaviernesmea oryzae]
MAKMRSRGTGLPTLAEVAAKAGVSPITASRALRAVPSVDPDLVERVRKAAKLLGYVPNPAARTLASARSRSVMVLIPALTNQLFIEMFEMIEQVLSARGFEALMGHYHYDQAEEERLIRNYLAYQPCGILVTGFGQSEVSARLLADCGLPRIHMMELAETADVASVGFSQEAAGAAVARHLIERGRRHFAFFGAQLDRRLLQRRDGFQRALVEAGFPPALEIMTPEPSSIALGAAQFSALRQTDPGIDAIFFCNDDLAFGASFEALRQGVRVPETIAFVGFNDLPGADQILPRLTSVRTPRAEIGRCAALRLLALIEGEKPADTRLDLGFELIVRDSS